MKIFETAILVLWLSLYGTLASGSTLSFQYFEASYDKRPGSLLLIFKEDDFKKTEKISSLTFPSQKEDSLEIDNYKVQYKIESNEYS